MNDLSDWKIFICCIISSLLTGIITTYVNKRIYESQSKPIPTNNNNSNNSNSHQTQQITSPHQFATHSNINNPINNSTNGQHIPIPPAPKNIPSTTVTLTKPITFSPQTHIAPPNKNGLLSHALKNSHSEHLHLINQVVSSYPDQIARKISIDNNAITPTDNKTDEIKTDNEDNIIRERIVIVSFKLPIIVEKLDTNSWHIEFDNEMSFLSNLRILENNDNKYEVVFVGWPGIYCENNNDEESLEDALYNLNKYRCYPIYLNKSQVELAYDTFCKTILWPSFHYQMCINDNGEFGFLYSSSWKAYCDLNCKYAKKALVAASDTDLDNMDEHSYIWFHDYHLLMAAQFVKKDNYFCKCGLFLHTVFPTSEVFRCLPSGKEILRGMLSNDLIGFHTYDYCRHFLSSCKRMLNLNCHTLPIDVGVGLAIHYLGRDIALRVSHIGIRSDYIKNKVNGMELNVNMNDDKFKYLIDVIKNKQERKLILSMGSNDIIHGTLYNLKAYNKFLEMSHESWRNELCFIQILHCSSYQKSRSKIKFVNNNINEIEKNILNEIDEIKNRYNKDCILLIDKYNYNELIALFRLCDIGLFGTFWEGFNCGPYEYTASQSGKDLPGALIISEFMGCHRSLSGVFRINPFDYELVANTLRTALVMTGQERRVSHYRRYKHVMTHTFYQWANQFIIDMKKAVKNTYSSNKKMVQFGLGSNLRLMYIQNDLKKLKCEENIEKMVYSFKKCKKRMLLFDFGGTLTDQYYEDNPNCMIIKKRVKLREQKYDDNFKQIINYLSILSLDPQTYVGIISGAVCKELEVAFKDCDKNIIICSEKGAFWKWPGMSVGEWEKNTSLDEDVINKWKEIAYDVMKIYCDKCDGSYIQKKSTALVWHYFLCDPEYGKMQAVELEGYLKRLLSFQFNNVTFQSYDHSRLLEILPKDIHKGTAAMTILNNIITQIENESDNNSVDKDDIFMLSVGNDRSDEKMFEAIELAKDNLCANENVFTISIGLKPTQSQYYISKQIDILWLLQILCNSLPNYNINDSNNNNDTNDTNNGIHGIGLDEQLLNNNAIEIQQSYTEMKYMISKLLKQHQKDKIWKENYNNDEKDQFINNNGRGKKLSVDISDTDKSNNNNSGDILSGDNVKTPQIDHLISPSPMTMNNIYDDNKNPIIQKMFN